eukprot:1143103-Pelagomonas_calceolata.AAC.2
MGCISPSNGMRDLCASLILMMISNSYHTSFNSRHQDQAWATASIPPDPHGLLSFVSLGKGDAWCLGPRSPFTCKEIDSGRFLLGYSIWDTNWCAKYITYFAVQEPSMVSLKYSLPDSSVLAQNVLMGDLSCPPPRQFSLGAGKLCSGLMSHAR